MSKQSFTEQNRYEFDGSEAAHHMQARIWVDDAYAELSDRLDRQPEMGPLSIGRDAVRKQLWGNESTYTLGAHGVRAVLMSGFTPIERLWDFDGKQGFMNFVHGYSALQEQREVAFTEGQPDPLQVQINAELRVC